MAGEAITDSAAPRVDEVYRALYRQHGPQHWWPARSRFEVMVGAVLTQNTAWRNVERAIAALEAAEVLSPEALLALEESALASLIRPSGYFNLKARRLRSLVSWLVDSGGFVVLDEWSTPALREALLGIHGVGPETADSILLYAFERPVFVVDAYTQRLFSRLGIVPERTAYETLRAKVEAELRTASAVADYNELHALIVAHGKDICRPRPWCRDCPMQIRCPIGRSVQAQATEVRSLR